MSNKYRSDKTTNYSHTMSTATATRTKAVCDRHHSLHRMTVVVTFVACLVALAHGSKYETQLKLLVNDDDLMLQQERNHAAAAMQQAHASPHHPEGAYNGDEHEHKYGTYRSELKRLSYETIHRILRDENEPIVRREDSDLRYYQKRSYEPLNAHAIEKRSAPESAKQMVSVDLSHKNLREFSAASVKITEDPASVTSIDLHDNILDHVELKGFDSLISLNLTNNSLTDLPDFTGLPHFASLVMNANRVRDVRPQTNYHLNALHLSGNAIVNLSTVQLSMLNALETLDLSCNAVSSLETSFFPQRMHNLKHLNLAHNRLGSIYRETFYNLLSLNTLLLAHNNISEIDYETFLALPNLQNLDLSYNNLKGESIRALQGIPDLVRLSIAYNPEVGALMQEFVASWSLKELDASGTGLCQIPAALAQSVRMLKLTDNWLKVISCGDLDSYPLLQYLDLSRSRIEDIEDDALGRLEILETLFLDHNRLRKVPLSLPTSLVHLFLHNNQIQDVQQQMFDSLNNLQTLDLSGNKLLYLPALPLPKLLTLNLQAAELKGLSQSIVHTMPQLRDLWLDDNPIKCSDLLGIAEWASPCRPPERSTLEIDDNAAGGAYADAPDGGGEGRKLGQQPSGVRQNGGKIDLKRNFLRMHNFYEKFSPENSSVCDAVRQQHEPERQQLRQRQMMAAPPGCVREFNDHVAPKTTEPPIGAPLTEVISSTNPTIMLMVKNVSTEAMTAAPITTTRQTPAGSKDAPSSSSITRPLKPETGSTNAATMQNQHLSAADNQINLSKSFNANKQTMLMVPSSAATPQQSTAVFADGSLNAKLPGQSASRPTKQQDGKLAEQPREQKIEQTTPQQQTLQKLQQRVLMKPRENELSEMTPTSRTTATDIIVAPSSMSSLYSGMKLSTGPDDHRGTGETTNFILKPTALVPHVATLPTAAAASSMKTDSNADAFRGLLSKKWLKLSKTLKRQSPIGAATAAAPTATVPPTTTTTANVISETPTTGQRLAAEAMPNAQTEANLADATVSGRRQSEKTPKLGDATTTTTEATTTPAPQPHHHNAMELHIKDRHLIGTPLLMHKGEHILVEAKLLPNFGGGPVATTTKAEHLAAVPADIAPVTTSAPLTTTITASIQRHEHERLKGNDINVLAQSQQQEQQRPGGELGHEAATTQTIKAVTNEAATIVTHRTKDVKVAGEAKQHTKKPSLVMKKMTITKMHNGHTQPAQQQGQQAQQQQPHHSLNTPRGQVGLTAHELAAQTTASDSKTATTIHRHPPEGHQHGSINKPRVPDPLMGSMKIPIRDHISNSLHQEHDREAPSKTEHLLDVRTAEESSGHPGLVFLLSFSLFIVLLVGLMHVYRCDVPWRRHLNAHHQRPHRHTLTTEDDSHSFLSYQQHHQPTAAAMQQWHHSLREQKPFQSPLHNLQVRELRPISAVDDRHHQRGLQPIGLYNGGGSGAKAMPPGSGESTPSGHSSPGSRSSSGSEHLDSNEAFYIEMTAESGQHAIHGDVLPMELLSSVSSSSAATSRQMTENESFLFNARDCDKDGQPQNAESVATTPKRSTMSGRKFALW